MGDVLKHHGILGQKWGVRRFQNSDGSLTSAGKKRYSNKNVKDDTPNKKGFSKDEIERKIKSNNTKSAALALSSVLVIPISTINLSQSRLSKVVMSDGRIKNVLQIDYLGPSGLARGLITTGAYVFAEAKLRSENKKLKSAL